MTLYPLGHLKEKRGKITRVGKGMGKLEPACTAGRNRKLYFRKQSGNFLKTQT